MNSIQQMVRELGIPSHLRGYEYLTDAIDIVRKDATALENVNESLYPRIAEKFETTPLRVERAIRHSIEIACCRGNSTLSEEDSKLSNAQFIALISQRVQN